jgi:uncharacterized coiled-coil DUF342 family protein
MDELTQLKAEGYDTVANIQALQNRLQQINGRINQLMQQAQQPKEEPKKE